MHEKKYTSLTIKFNFIVNHKPLIRQLSAPELIMNHMSSKITQANTPVDMVFKQLTYN